MRYVYLALMLLFLPIVMPKVYELSLLAVNEQDVGSVAELSLEVKPGQGRVFIDTYPLTRVDTQISTRYARSIACNQLELDCSNRDFFYTIHSNSVIVGGPSAGAALTALTIIALQDYNYDNDIAVTGTINSGGIIGPVGGLEPKIAAAHEAGIKSVMIPSGERFVERNNRSIDLVSLGQDMGMQIIEVATIDDVLYQFTGRKPEDLGRQINTESIYTSTMMNISKQLCDRTAQLRERVSDINATEYADNLTVRAKTASLNNESYSAASFCFGANIRLAQQILVDENITSEELQTRIHREQGILLDFKQKLRNHDLSTITDLQVYEIVMERVMDSEDNYLESVQLLQEDELEAAINSFAYAVERYNSAISWSSYFGMDGKALSISEEDVHDSCIQKLAEAQERFQYVLLYANTNVQDTAANIQKAEEYLQDREYELCLFKATKAKAEADIVLSAMSISQENLDTYVTNKLDLVRHIIIKQQDKGNFPILGYSYYEYAGTLKQSDPYSAMLYAEYALELSNLDMYFKPAKKRVQLQFDNRLLIAFVLGMILGATALNLYRKKKVC